MNGQCNSPSRLVIRTQLSFSITLCALPSMITNGHVSGVAGCYTERDRTEKLLVEAAERQRELEERRTKMLEEERARNDMQARAMYELLVVSFFCRLLASLNI